MTSNKRRRHRPDQIIRKLAEGNKQLASGQALNEVCRHLEIAESTWHRWLAQYGGMKANEAKRLKELEAENARLKKLLANQASTSHAQGDRRGKLLTPKRARRRFGARDRFGVSERRACRVVGQHRSTMRLTPPPSRRRRPSCVPGCGGSPPPSPLGVATGTKMPAGRVAGQQQAHPPAVAGRGAAGPQRRKRKRLTGIGVAVGAMSPIRPNVSGRWTSSSTRPPMAAP